MFVKIKLFFVTKIQIHTRVWDSCPEGLRGKIPKTCKSYIKVNFAYWRNATYFYLIKILILTTLTTLQDNNNYTPKSTIERFFNDCLQPKPKANLLQSQPHSQANWHFQPTINRWSSQNTYIVLSVFWMAENRRLMWLMVSRRNGTKSVRCPSEDCTGSHFVHYHG